jgi:hypothetical protein
MSAITAAAPARRTAPDTREPHREILTRIARAGLLICETELRYQLAHHGHHGPELLDLLAELQQQGLIESEIHYRLTPAGAERLPPAERPAPQAIGSIPWSSPPPAVPAAGPSARAQSVAAASVSPARPATSRRRAIRPRRETERAMT